MDSIIRMFENIDKDPLFDLFCELIKYNAYQSGEIEYWLHSNWLNERKNDFDRAMGVINRIIYVVERENKLVGYAYVFYCPEENICVLEELFVLAEYRGLGYGKEMVCKCINWAKTMKLPIKVEMYPWNKYAMDWYKQFGFRLDSHSYLIE